MAEAEDILRQAEEKYHLRVGELTVAVGMRSAETKVAESLGMSSTTDVSANVVGVSGTASVDIRPLSDNFLDRPDCLVQKSGHDD